MLNILILGTEATSYIFNSKVDPYFDERNFKVDVCDIQQVTNIDLNLYINKEIDIIIFDVIMDVIIYQWGNDLKNKLQKFVFSLREKFPKAQIIYNQTRYATKTLIDNDWDFKNEHPIDSFIPNYSSYAWNRNNKLESIDDLIINDIGVAYIKYEFSCSGLEYNSGDTRKIFTFNESYYLQKLMCFFKIVDSDSTPHITETSFPNNELDFDSDILLINNLLLNELKTNEMTYQFIQEILLHDFVLDGRYGRTVRFIKRKLFYRPEFQTIFGINHIIEFPTKNKVNVGINKVVFYFCGLDWRFNPNGRELFAPSYLHRDLMRSLMPDTLVVRIADVNLLWGSWYHNTSNYPEYEKNIIALIKYYQDLYQVSDSHTMLFGVSRGGHAALYYSKIIDLPVVSVAPPIDVILFRDFKRWYDFYNLWWKKDILKNFLIERNQIYPKVIIDDASVKSTFDPLKLINDSRTFLFNLGRKTTIKHGKVAGLSVPLQYSLINGIVSGFININSLSSVKNDFLSHL